MDILLKGMRSTLFWRATGMHIYTNISIHMYTVSLYSYTGISHSTYTQIFIGMYISIITSICIYWSISTHEIRFTYVGVWFYAPWNQHSVLNRRKTCQCTSHVLWLGYYGKCNSWMHAFKKNNTDFYQPRVDGPHGAEKRKTQRQ